MGANFANEMADGTLAELGIELTMEQQIGYHLQCNFYPPVPSAMVQPCIEAIEAYWNDDTSAEISLPEPITWKGLTYAPAYAILEQHHLESWTANYDYDAYWDSMEEN